MTTMLRGHPPTVAGVAAALVASIMTDLTPLLTDTLPAISETTVGIATMLAVGLAGGVIGRVAERWTIPWVQPEDPGQMVDDTPDADS